MISYQSFVAMFPEFSDRVQSEVEAVVAQTLIETSEYEGLHDLVLQQQALALHVAHNLELADRAKGEGKYGPVKSLASNNDKVEYAVNPSGSQSLDSTDYGVRLQVVIRRAQTIFAVR